MKELELHRPPVVPIEYAGNWIAWNSERTKIVASGENLRQVEQEALTSGEPQPGFEWIPPADSPILGIIP